MPKLVSKKYPLDKRGIILLTVWKEKLFTKKLVQFNKDCNL